MRGRLGSLLLTVALVTTAGARAEADAPFAAAIAAPHPLAVEAGLDALRAGGSAVDAAVAVQMVLTLVEAPETGIGGGGFLLMRDADGDRLHFYDGRETAPAAAEPDRFLIAGRIAMPRWLAVPDGHAVGTPGLLAMLHLAHAEHGRLPWRDLVEPAATMARVGVPMPGRLRRQIEGDPSLRLFGTTRRRFLDRLDADPRILRNPELAATLDRIAREGPAAFYRGAIARRMVDAVDTRWPRGGDLALEDLAAYRAVERPPVCGRYRGYHICGAAPPSSGGITVLQILGILEHFDLAALGPADPRALHLVAEASRLAFADRQRWIGDPDFVTVPVAALLDPDYLARRAALVEPDRALAHAPAGAPPDDPRLPAAGRPPPEHEAGTSHTSIVDAQGNAVSLTSSIEKPFGARIVTSGFLLNNQLTDFDFRPRRDGRLVANAVAPGKRPRSSMSPTLVFAPDGELRLVIGSRGGSRIIGYVVKTLLGVLDWDLSLQAAIELPNFVHRGRQLELERDTRLVRLAEPLRRLGHRVRLAPLTSGLHGIRRVGSGWTGAADPRVDGAYGGLPSAAVGDGGAARSGDRTTASSHGR